MCVYVVYTTRHLITMWPLDISSAVCYDGSDDQLGGNMPLARVSFIISSSRSKK